MCQVHPLQLAVVDWRRQPRWRSPQACCSPSSDTRQPSFLSFAVVANATPTPFPAIYRVHKYDDKSNPTVYKLPPTISTEHGRRGDVAGAAALTPRISKSSSES